MNIVLADVQSPSINPTESVEDSNTGADEFSELIRSSIEENPDNNEQVIENKELISGSPDLEAIDGAEIPPSWTAYLSTAEPAVTTDPSRVTITLAKLSSPVPGVGLETRSNSSLLDPNNSLSKPIVGEPLPLDGKVLPSNSAATGSLPVSDSRYLIQPAGTPVAPPKELTGDSGAGETRRTGLARGEGRLFTLGPEQNSSFNFDKLSDSVLPKVLEMPPGENNPVDPAVARQLGAIPTATHPGLQASMPLPTQLAPLSIARPDSPVEWSNGIGDRVAWMINQKLNTATIRLDPPSLGKLEIHIQLRDETTTITIYTQSAQTRDLIDNASVRLREVLQEAGYQNVNVDVGHDRDQPRFGTQQNAELTADSSDNGRQLHESVDDVKSASGHFYPSDSLIDYFA